MESERLKEQLNALPAQPGVYLLRDQGGNVLYVGKAASLRHRVRSHFGPGPALTPKLERMRARVHDLDFIVTDSEQEAVILECNLIKRHRPRYNVRLKDDKSYPYLKISLNEQWPRVYVTRRVEPDGSCYFGPFASAGSVRQTLSLVRRLFPFRTCRRPITAPTRPCLEYHIKRCLGPCLGTVSPKDYAQVIRQVIMFLEGKQEAVVKGLRRRMEAAARRLDFEQAAMLRDQLQAVERTIERQKITSPGRGELDVIALARAGDVACVEVFFIRHGKLLGREEFILEGTQDETPEQVMTSFVKQYYATALKIPPLVLLQHEVEEPRLLAHWLAQRRGGKVSLGVPRRGEKRQLVDMVAENARQGLELRRVKQLSDSEALATALVQLKEALALPSLPNRVECYDISDIRGTSAVGSMVVFQEGRPKPAHYRRFRIKTVDGADDCAMLGEVLRRRFKRGTTSAEEGWGITPDLLLVDGGKGQLNAALEAMREQGADSVPAASLAKEYEEVYLPGRAEPVRLPSNSPALYLLQRIRDEAHRFAWGYHQRMRRTQGMASALDSVPGIGPKRKRALLRHFGSIGAIREASVEELASVTGMTPQVAARVKEYL
ncbi:MAG TPA: excinuclease ABC subunit UvrC [Dehalococcoidia bacterium]|nr:excinuclease ABC subunit UvrC [Dehalococcoidia bacterium]